MLSSFILVQNTSHSTMLIIVICTSFVILICGVGIARLRGNQQQKKIDKQHQQTQAKVILKKKYFSQYSNPYIFLYSVKF